MERKYPFPFRTRKSSSLTPMILLFSGKVGSCWHFLFNFYYGPCDIFAFVLRPLKSRGSSVAGKAGALIGKALKNNVRQGIILALSDKPQVSDLSDRCWHFLFNWHFVNLICNGKLNAAKEQRLLCCGKVTLESRVVKNKCKGVCLDSTRKASTSIFYLGFITNPKNGRLKGLNEVSLDRTYWHVRK